MVLDTVLNSFPWSQSLHFLRPSALRPREIKEAVLPWLGTPPTHTHTQARTSSSCGSPHNPEQGTTNRCGRLEGEKEEVGSLNLHRKEDCLLGSRGGWVWGRSCSWLLGPAGRRRQVAGNGESLRNVSRREGWASGTRRNAQTRTLVRGRGRAKETVEAGESLPKKKKSNSKKVTIPSTHAKPPFSGSRELSLLSHPQVTRQQTHGPTSSRGAGVRPTAVSGAESVLGRETPGLGTQGQASLPLSRQTPSPAPFQRAHP